MKIRASAVAFALLLGLAPIGARASCASQNTSNYYADIERYAGASLVGYFPLTDASGAGTALECSGATGASNGTPTSVTFGSTGLVSGSTDTAASFSGATPSKVVVPYSGSWYVTLFDNGTAGHFEADIDVTGITAHGGGIIASQGVFANGSWTWFVTNDGSANHLEVNWNGVGGSGYLSATTTSETIALTGKRHVSMIWAGSGSGATSDLTLSIDGEPQPLTVTINSLGTHSFHGTSNLTIGQPFNSGDSLVVQHLAFYNTSDPAGATPHLSNLSGNPPRDALDFYHGQGLRQNNQPPFAAPSTSCVVFEKDYSDVDVINDINTAVWLAFKHQWTLCAIMVNSAYPPNAASATRALLDAWNLRSVPVYNYQGTGGVTGTPDNGFTNAIQANYRPQDSTNVGIKTFTPVVGGSGFSVGDIFQINGGTVASGFGAAKYVVLAVSGSSVATARIKESGSYSTAPSGTVTTTAITGGGTGLTGTITTASGKGNFGDAEWALHDLIAAHPGNVTLINGGQSHLDYALSQDHPTDLCSLSAVGVMQGDNPNNVLYGNGGEFNAGATGSEWNAFYGVLAGCSPKITVVSYGVENTEGHGSGNSQWVYMGENPKSTLNGASVSGTSLTFSSVASGTVNVGDYVYGASIQGGLKIVSGSGTSWTLNTSVSATGPETMFTNGWDNPAIVAFINSSTADGSCASSSPAFKWCRLSWTPVLMYALQSGVNPLGSGRQLYAMWMGNNGKMFMDSTTPCGTSATGQNCWSPSTQWANYVLQRTASDSIINNQNLLVANDNPANYLPLFRRQPEPGARAGSRRAN